MKVYVVKVKDVIKKVVFTKPQAHQWANLNAIVKGWDNSDLKVEEMFLTEKKE